MKKITAFLILVPFVYNTQAQLTDSTFTEIGVNATAFVNQYLDFGNDEDDVMSPYIFIAERKLGKIGIRGGLGVDTSTDKEFPDDDNGNTSLHSTDTELAARLGVVWYSAITDRWNFRFGVDGAFANDLEKSKTVSLDFFGTEVKTIIANKQTRAGGGPFVFMQYNISKRVSLATELTAYFMLTTTTESITNSAFPEFDDEDKNQAYGFSIPPPTALFITWRF